MRCVIVGGADIRDYGSIRKQLRPDDYVVYCDSGLRHMDRLQAAPCLIVGSMLSVLDHQKGGEGAFYSFSERCFALSSALE